MEGSQCSVAVKGCLTSDGQPVVVVAVVHADVHEVVTLGSIATVAGGLLLGHQVAVQMGIYRIGIDVQRTLAPARADAKVGLMGVMFLGNLGGCAVVSVGQQGACRSVAVERGIQWTVGGKGCEVPPMGQA